jgi:ribonuclease-3
MTEMSRSERRASRPAMPLHDHLAALPVLIRRLGHRFADSGLLDIALTHPSWRNEHAPGQADNQRLEFLGDAVLGLVITQELVLRLPQRREGELTVLKSQLVRESSLAQIAELLLVGQALRLGRGEDQTGGRQRPSVLADAMEALLGAVFLDAGYEKVREVVLELFGTPLDTVVSQVEAPGLPLSASTANWKTAVQELLQQLGSHPPTYTLVAEDGPVHARRFRVQATTAVGPQAVSTTGEGASKKAAENEAAEAMYRQVEAMRGPEPGPQP